MNLFTTGDNEVRPGFGEMINIAQTGKYVLVDIKKNSRKKIASAVQWLHAEYYPNHFRFGKQGPTAGYHV